MIAGLGAVLGLGLAWAGIRELLAIAPATLPRLQSIAIDPGVLMFTMIATLAAAALFGITPAIRGSRPDVMNILRSSGRTSGLGGGRFLRNAVVVAEVALSFVLLVGSGLMIRTFQALRQIDLGYNPHNLLTTLIVGGRGGTTPQEREHTFERFVKDCVLCREFKPLRAPFRCRSLEVFLRFVGEKNRRWQTRRSFKPPISSSSYPATSKRCALR